jgi:hypothetical protein
MKIAIVFVILGVFEVMRVILSDAQVTVLKLGILSFAVLPKSDTADAQFYVTRSSFVKCD